ncbi:unnamed protein product, partial [Rotaria sordida]
MVSLQPEILGSSPANGEIRARPFRGSCRQEIQKYTKLGATPGAVRRQKLQSMSVENKEAGNRNVVGRSPSVLRKTASEANVNLRRDADLEKSLHCIKAEQAEKIFPGESIPGYLQEISVDPLRLICFTAGGIVMYHQNASTMPLSWDATGGIVVNRGKRVYYYELSMPNLSKGGPSLSVTAMLSTSHGTVDIIHWMNCFIEKYKMVYGFAKPFPKPPVIHSDRALVFLLAGIQLFNGDETMNLYIERCWRIIQGRASQQDLQVTVVHACLGHLMKNVKTNAAKDLTKKQIPFGMWLMALLVNSVGQLSQTLRFENKRNNSWYNSTMQMLLASGHLVQTVRRVGLMDNDLTPDHIYQFSTALYYLVKRDEHMTEARRIINDEMIKNTINCLTWCGFE